MAHERKCIVDQTTYEYCNHCGSFNPYETWRFLFCCENCRKIYDVISKFISGTYTAKEARKELEECDMSGYDHFHSTMKADLDKIIAIAGFPVKVSSDLDNVSDEDLGITEPVTKIEPRSVRKQRKTKKIDE